MRFLSAPTLARLTIALAVGSCGLLAAQTQATDSFVVNGWQMQDATKVQQQGPEIASSSFSTSGWYRATVPGTVLTTLVDNHVYPDPLYGENNRATVIPETLAHTPFWYRSVVSIPKAYNGRHIWLHFDGINYSATVWVNGQQVGTMRGAFSRGLFDISGFVHPGTSAALAVLVTPQPHPGIPHEHTLRAGVGQNGGDTALDGPTFLSTIGWDWLATVRDRDTGIWQKVWISDSGPVVEHEVHVTTDLKLPGYETAGVTVTAIAENVTGQPQQATLRGSIGDIKFERTITLPAHAKQTVTFDPTTDPVLLLQHPRLWWPNGYGKQNLYKLHIQINVNKIVSEEEDVSFGVRSISYTVASTDALAFVVNGVPIFIRGGDWGMDDAMKRIPLDRLEAQIRMHKLANLNMIRNWVGQSTSEEFFALCDKYGLLVWDEFFQPNPVDGPNPIDLPTYMANVRDTVVRYRNHPSIVLWCARNEGNPPEEINAAMKTMLAELDPTRLYQANSSDGRSVRSHGPYRWRTPRDFYWINEGFKSETGSMSIPTIESIQGMMPRKDWETITDDWAEHDFAKGAVAGDAYPAVIAERYGKIANLADFVRKSQLANYEAFQSMYEGRNAQMFNPATGILTWMSHPAQPSFVWQLYHYDLEPNSSLYAVQSASEMIHVQFNQVNGLVQVVNNFPKPLNGTSVDVQVLNLDGTLGSRQTLSVNVPPSSVADAGGVVFHEPLTDVFFIRLTLTGNDGKLLSQNFYWLNHPEQADRLASLNSMPKVQLEGTATRVDQSGTTTLSVTLKNPSSHIALMAHLQLRRKLDGTRVLPVFYDHNYISLLGGESRTITITCNTSELKDSDALVVLDGWNDSIVPATTLGVSLDINQNADVDHWPVTGLPFQKN